MKSAVFPIQPSSICYVSDFSQSEYHYSFFFLLTSQSIYFFSPVRRRKRSTIRIYFYVRKKGNIFTQPYIQSDKAAHFVPKLVFLYISNRVVKNSNIMVDFNTLQSISDPRKFVSLLFLISNCYHTLPY